MDVVFHAGLHFQFHFSQTHRFIFKPTVQPLIKDGSGCLGLDDQFMSSPDQKIVHVITRLEDSSRHHQTRRQFTSSPDQKIVHVITRLEDSSRHHQIRRQFMSAEDSSCHHQTRRQLMSSPDQKIYCVAQQLIEFCLIYLKQLPVSIRFQSSCNDSPPPSP